MKKSIIFSLIAAATLSLTGCGSSDSDDNNVATSGRTTVLSAQFIDAAVEGLSYSCLPSEKMGFTNQNGYFNYVSGDTCYFFVGDTLLGNAQITGTTTPRTLTTIEPDLTNMLRLLQTLDTDEDPSNGITLPAYMAGDINLGVNFDAQVQGFLDQNNIQNALVTATDANQHFEQSVPFSFDENTFKNSSYTFSHPYMEDDLVFNFDTNHRFTSSRDESGTWSIQNGTLTLVVMNSSIHYDIVLTNNREANLSQYLVSDGTRFAEQELAVTYSVHSITLVANPSLVGTWTGSDIQLICTDDMITETYSTSGSFGVNEYSYILAGDTTLNSGRVVQRIELHRTYGTITLTTQSIVDQFNQDTAFGYSDWSLNTTKDVTAAYSNFDLDVRKELLSIQDDFLILTAEYQTTIYPDNLNTVFTFTRSN